MFPAVTKQCFIWATQAHTSIPQTGRESKLFVIYPIVRNSHIIYTLTLLGQPMNLPNPSPLSLNKFPNDHAIQRISRILICVAMPNLSGNWCNHSDQIGAQKTPLPGAPRPINYSGLNVTIQPKSCLVEVVKSTTERLQFPLLAAASCVAFSICDLGILSSNSSLNLTIRFLSFADLVTSPARIAQRSAST